MVSGTDMTGRTCMITGATSGIGQAAALELARLGAGLVLVGRNAERGERVLEEVRRASSAGDVTLLLADLSSQSEIRRLAADFLASGRPLHVLLNNAGVINLRREESGDGIETTFAVNHLAYFLLTTLLLERLKEGAPARVVNVASDAHRGAGRLDFDDLESQRSYSPMRVYGRSKLANILFTRELARRLEGTGVTANSMHPGFVGSNFAKNNGLLGVAAMTLLRPFARSPEKGAETAVYLCSSPKVEGVTGEYFQDCKPHRPRPFALDDEDAHRLWEVSERMTGLAA
jgi:NAD(P)-dependent dehydrogenase (short-subunit alcohol dehydrogenase family)